MDKQKALVAMSGGVDSSVAAALMLEEIGRASCRERVFINV